LPLANDGLKVRIAETPNKSFVSFSNVPEKTWEKIFGKKKKKK
jgi:hypothetical protein